MAAKSYSVRIETKEFTDQGGGTFELVPTGLDAGPLATDSGRFTVAVRLRPGIVRNGQADEPIIRTTTFAGKRGTLVLRARIDLVGAGHLYEVGTGPWTLLRGTGSYANLTGGGRIGLVWTASGWIYLRYEGLVRRRG